MDKIKDLNLKIETFHKHKSKKTTDEQKISIHSHTDDGKKSKDKEQILIKYILSTLENLEYLIHHRHIDNDDYHLRFHTIQQIYNEVISKKIGTKKLSDFYNEIKKIIKHISFFNVKDILQFFYQDIHYSNIDFHKSISKEYLTHIELYNQFFHPLSCEIVCDDKEIENLHKYARTQDKHLPSSKLNHFKSYTLEEKIEGLTLIFPNYQNNHLVLINGFFKKDSLGIIKNHQLFKNKNKSIEEDIEYVDIPLHFKKLYISQLSTRDFVYLHSKEIITMMKTDYEEFIILRNKNLSLLVKDFMKSSIERQRKIMTLFLLYDSNTQFSAHVIYDLLTSQNIYMNGMPIYDLLYQSLHCNVQALFKQTKNIEEDTKKKLSNLQVSDIPYDVRIANMKCTDFVKSKAFEKYKEIQGSKDNSVKAQQWLDGLLKIPFGVYKEEKIIKFFEEFQNKVDNYIQITSLKLIQYDELQLQGKNKKLYTLFLSLINYYKKCIKDHSDNEYDLFIESCKDVLIKSLIYIPLLSMNMKFEYNQEKFLLLKEEIYKEESLFKSIQEDFDNMDMEEFTDKDAENFNIECQNKKIRLGKERSDSVDITSNDILQKLNIDQLSERNQNIILDMIKKEKFPDETILEKCILELSEIRKMKNQLLQSNMMNENNLKLLFDKLNTLECSIIYEDDYDIDEDTKEDDRDESPLSPSLSNNVNREFRRFILRNFYEIDSIVMEWIEFKKSKKDYMKYIDKTLDKCVHGHLESKQQIKRLVGQMMNGTSKKGKRGFCLGLQGPPGVGKTTICLNGLAKCLMDEDGESRPIIFIPLGGSSNGSTLEGHNYTYLGSTWGKIADALMEAKCMNPIIFIDELDKISKTEHGREIASILTHMTDQTQNSEFFDKYFASIPLDLSKVIFIFSYNDRNNVDKILLDRIQEVNIKPLSKQDKVIISKNYVLPEIYKNTGFSKDEIHFPSKLLCNIIENYTYEAGVRKLSELLNDIVRELNLRRIMGTEFEYPISITEELVDEILDDKPKMSFDKVIQMPLVGVSYGMYASSVGYGGGISKIQTIFIPSSNKKLSIQKATGLAGDMMKESFDVCMSVAYNLIPDDIKKNLSEREDNGIHIHFNDSSVNKDGPSGGQAITLSLVSLLTGVKVRNNVAITGEINLLGFAMKIGGVYSKITGSIRAGINTFIIPKENREDIVQMIRSENRNIKNLKETYSNENASPYIDKIPLKRTSSFLNIEPMNEVNDDIEFEMCEMYDGVEFIYYKHCKVYLVDNIYQVLQIALMDHSIQFKSLF
jgi:ATP-dependent Lon protease